MTLRVHTNCVLHGKGLNTMTKSKTVADIQAELNSARLNVVDAEKELSTIKVALRNLSTQLQAQTASAQQASNEDGDGGEEKEKEQEEEVKNGNLVKFWVTKVSHNSTSITQEFAYHLC